MRLLISGGGTGGHVYPGLAVAEQLKQKAESRRQADVECLYVGRAEGIEARVSLRAGIAFKPIDVAAIRGMMPWVAAWNMVRLIKSVGQVRSIIRTFKPNIGFATGGYVSAPVIWASSIEHVPSVLYLPDLEPGWAIR